MSDPGNGRRIDDPALDVDASSIMVPRYLYWTDRLGLPVWEEMPSAYRFTRTAIKRLVREWLETIARATSRQRTHIPGGV